MLHPSVPPLMSRTDDAFGLATVLIASRLVIRESTV